MVFIRSIRLVVHSQLACSISEQRGSTSIRLLKSIFLINHCHQTNCGFGCRLALMKDRAHLLHYLGLHLLPNLLPLQCLLLLRLLHLELKKSTIASSAAIQSRENGGFNHSSLSFMFGVLKRKIKTS